MDSKLKALFALGFFIALISFFGLPPHIEAWLLFVLGVVVCFTTWRLFGASGHHAEAPTTSDTNLNV